MSASKHHTIPSRPRPKSRTLTKRLPALALPVVLFLAACQTTEWDSGGWRGQPAHALSEQMKTMPHDPAALEENGAGGIIRNALALAEQKRFPEARDQLAVLREHQEIHGEGYRSVTAAMASVSLKSGDISGFRRIARQLESGIERDIRVDPGIVDIIALARHLDGRPVPVNTTQSLTHFLSNLPRSAGKTTRAR